MTVDQAIESCTRLTKEHSSTFYLGSRLFPPTKRSAVSVIYAACRSGDDAVDEAGGPDEARANVRSWYDSIDRAYRGGDAVRDDRPLEIGLRWVLDRYPVPRSAFDELYLGLESDISFSPIADTQALMLYCRRVAGVVGLLVAPVAGYRGGDETLDYAVALGQAMQLTNILRDVGEDLARGRCYLPQDRMAAHGVEIDDLKAGVVGSGYIALLEELAQLAHELYRLGWKGIPSLHGVTATAVGVAALNYEGIVRKLRQNRHDNLTQRAYLRPLERIALIPRAVAGVVTGAG
jgi:phytoene synthase